MMQEDAEILSFGEAPEANPICASRMFLDQEDPMVLDVYI